MAVHRFQVGQVVFFRRSFAGPKRGGSCEILRLMPEAGGEPQYRVRDADRMERAVAEGQLARTQID